MTIILDPTDERVPVARQISERSGSVQGVVGLLNISKPRGNILLDELDRLLTENAPGVEIRHYTGRRAGGLRIMYHVQYARYSLV